MNPGNRMQTREQVRSTTGKAKGVPASPVFLLALMLFAPVHVGDAADISVQVGLTYSPEQRVWTADYRLSEPLRRFRFADRFAGPLRSDNWTAEDGALDIRDNHLESEAPLLEFTLRLATDDAEHDKIYPAVIAVGQGSLVNTSYLLGENPTTIVVKPGKGQFLVVPDRDVPVVEGPVTLTEPSAEEYYVYLGPGPIQRQESFRMTVGDEVPDWIGQAVRHDLNDAIDEYALLLGIGQAVKATVYVSHQGEPSRCSYRGDVSSHGVTSLRFRGRCWEVWDEKAGTIRDFVRHEAFHYWNRGSKDNASKPWLHEGAAEYFAKFGSVGLDHALYRCWNTGGPDACGHAMHLAGDRLLERSGGGAMREVWKAVLQRRIEYSLDDVLAAARELGAPPDFRDMVLSVIDAPDTATRKFVVDRLGLDHTYFVGLELRRGLKHVLRANCPGRHGFWELDEGLRLDAPDCGGGLVHKAIVAAIDDIPLADATAAADAIAEKCGTEEPLEFSGPAGDSFVVRCPDRWRAR